jgi:hypothetical protein
MVELIYTVSGLFGRTSPSAGDTPIANGRNELPAPRWVITSGLIGALEEVGARAGTGSRAAGKRPGSLD